MLITSTPNQPFSLYQITDIEKGKEKTILRAKGKEKEVIWKEKSKAMKKTYSTTGIKDRKEVLMKIVKTKDP